MPVTTIPAEKKAPAVESDKAKGQRLTNQALRTLRDNHFEEYEKEVKALFAANGLTYSRRLTAEEKAQEQIKALLAEHPALAAQFGPVKVADTVEAPVTSDES